MTLGEFFREILDHLYGLWPVRVILDWEQGVRVRHGNATALLTSTNGLFKTGLHVFWPVLGDIIKQTTNIETPETERQDLITADGELISFSLAVRYKVHDLRAHYLKIHDQDATVLEEVRSAAADVVRQLALAEVRGVEFGEKVLEQVKKQTWGWGLTFISVSPVNMTTAPQLRLITELLGRSAVSSE
jgi:regulator of protease activity HflC (stomatin/prohibitin superfamily)